MQKESLAIAIFCRFLNNGLIYAISTCDNFGTCNEQTYKHAQTHTHTLMRTATSLFLRKVQISS